MKNDLFINVVLKGVMGAIVGIIAGFALGFFIYGLASLVPLILKQPDPSFQGGQDAAFPIIGMCFGALIGSILGGYAALKEWKR